jgi:uncharacterized cupredoxin-like copper-binding protein
MSSLKTPLAACAVAAGALALTACGSSSKSSSTSTPASTPAAPTTTSSSSSGGGGSTTSSSSSGGGGLALAAEENGGLSFDKKTLTAKAGKVTLTMDNGSGNSQPHGVAVEGKGVDKDGKVVGPGGKSTVTVTLKPGTYEFYCPVPGHKAAGMEGKLTVQ